MLFLIDNNIQNILLVKPGISHFGHPYVQYSTTSHYALFKMIPPTLTTLWFLICFFSKGFIFSFPLKEYLPIPECCRFLCMYSCHTLNCWYPTTTTTDYRDLRATINTGMDIRMAQQYKIIKKQNFYFLIFHLIWFFSPPMGNFFDMQQTLETMLFALPVF